MQTQRDIIRVVSLLFCLYFLALTGIGEVVWNRVPGGVSDAFAGRRAISTNPVNPGRTLQASGTNHGVALKHEQLQSQQASMCCSDLFEEESYCHFNILNSTPPHILFALSGQDKPSSIRMKPAGRRAKLYLVNSTLRC